MATERFMKLSQDKKDRILDAAVQEFARVPFEDASINQIIKAAGISRGSFYTYFEDKRDLLYYIFQNMNERHEQCFKELLLRKQGDFWEALHTWVTSISEQIQSGCLQLEISLMTQQGMMHRMMEFAESEGIDSLKEQKFEWLCSRVCKDCIKGGEDAETFIAVIRLGFTVAMMTLMALIGHRSMAREQILRNFEISLEVLRAGADPRAAKNIN